MTKRGSAVTYRPQKNVVTITIVLQKAHIYVFKPYLRLIFEMKTDFRTLYDKDCNINKKQEQKFPLKNHCLSFINTKKDQT